MALATPPYLGGLGRAGLGPLGLLVACSGFLRARLYGMRSHKKKRLVEGFKKLLEEVEKSG